jgi:hypothetical protein
MRASYANESNHLRERAAEMRASSKELRDDSTAAVIMRVADLYERLAIAPRPEAKQYRQTQSQKKAAHQHGLRCVASYDRLRNAFRPAAVTTTSAPRRRPSSVP